MTVKPVYLLIITHLIVACMLGACRPTDQPTVPRTEESAAGGQAATVPTKDETAESRQETTAPSEAAGWWRPGAGLTWQLQFTGDVNLDIQVDMIDIDLDEDPAVVEYFHARGTRVLCYISVGSYEDWREDVDDFPPEVLGKDYEGWAGEKWLDIRQIDMLAPIMRKRLDQCAARGFDGVEADNLEIYTNDTGFPLTYEDQLAYALWLAEEAHARGLAIGQKNAPDQVGDLVDVYDFAVTEDAFYYDWAEEMLPYIQLNKPVFAIEYTDLPGDFMAFCEQSKTFGFSTILKNRDLDAWLETCP